MSIAPRLRRRTRGPAASRSEKPEEWELLELADRSAPDVGIGILRDLYLGDPWGTTAAGRAIADDPEAIGFLVDYWRYVKWNEHGNEASLSEVGFEDLADMIIHPASS